MPFVSPFRVASAAVAFVLSLAMAGSAAGGSDRVPFDSEHVSTTQVRCAIGTPSGTMLVSDEMRDRVIGVDNDGDHRGSCSGRTTASTRRTGSRSARASSTPLPGDSGSVRRAPRQLVPLEF